MSRRKEESSPTIVGGQPVGKRDLGTGLPHGLEAIVLLAAAEPAFREEFSRDRIEALKSVDINLTETEQEILETISDPEIFAMAKRVSIRSRTPRRSLRATAASLAALASLTTSTPPRVEAGGSSTETRPALSQLDAQGPRAQAESPGRSPTQTPPPVATGIQPDTPTPTTTEPPIDGIRPDTPTSTQEPVRGTLTGTPPPTATPLGILTDTPTPTPDADLDDNGIVDGRDLLLFLQEWYRARAEQSKSDVNEKELE